jgi:hypothetical protein
MDYNVFVRCLFYLLAYRASIRAVRRRLGFPSSAKASSSVSLMINASNQLMKPTASRFAASMKDGL